MSNIDCNYSSIHTNNFVNTRTGGDIPMERLPKSGSVGKHKSVGQKPLFSITIEIAEEKRNLKVFKHDTPAQIAVRFCAENGWDLACVDPIATKIAAVFRAQLADESLLPKLRKKLLSITLPPAPPLSHPTFQPSPAFNSPKKSDASSNSNRNTLALPHFSLQSNNYFLEQQQQKQTFQNTNHHGQHDYKHQQQEECQQGEEQQQQHELEQSQGQQQQQSQQQGKQRTKYFEYSSKIANLLKKESNKLTSSQSKIQQQQPQQQIVSRNSSYSLNRSCEKPPRIPSQSHQTDDSLSNAMSSSSTNYFSTGKLSRNQQQYLLYQQQPQQQQFSQLSKSFQNHNRTSPSRKSLDSQNNSNYKNSSQSKDRFGQQSTSQKENNGSSSNKQLHSSLYDRGLEYLGKKEQKIEQVKHSINQSIKDACPFIPETNVKLNSLLLQHRDRPDDHLYSEAKLQHIRRSQMKERITEEEDRDYSFKPALNEISLLIANSKPQSEYEQQRQARRSITEADMQRECTFHPSINNQTKAINASKLPRSSYGGPLTYDGNSASGGANTTPAVLSVYDRLYQDSETIQKRKKAAAIQNYRSSNNGNSTNSNNMGSKGQQEERFVASKNSQEMIERKKAMKIQSIFQTMDSDQDGLISAANIDVHSLPDEVLLILAPLLYELEDLNAELSITEFTEAFNRLYTSLSPAEKNKLLMYDMHAKWEEEKEYWSSVYTPFQPTINPMSQEISSLIRPERADTKNLYDLYKHNDELSELRLQEKRRQKQLEIDNECTFHPNTRIN